MSDATRLMKRGSSRWRAGTALACAVAALATTGAVGQDAATDADAEGDAGVVMKPVLTKPWTEAQPIVKNGNAFHSDFCLIKDKLDRWHAIGIGGREGRDDSFFHAIGESLTEPYEYQDKIHGQVESTPQHMWAPYAVWLDDERALMYYCHIAEGQPTTLRVLSAEAPGLEEWTPYEHPDFKRENVLLEDPSNRDACIFWDDDVDAYLMYYAAQGPWRDEGAREVIRCRTSKDLINWSDAVSVMGPPPEYQAAESPFVLKRNGLYYLWVSGFDYGRMSLYISEDPFDFGHPVENRIEEQSGHAPELVRENGKDYIACAAIASKFGNRPAEHDIFGVYIQELGWEELAADAHDRIFRKDGEGFKNAPTPPEPAQEE